MKNALLTKKIFLIIGISLLYVLGTVIGLVSSHYVMEYFRDIKGFLAGMLMLFGCLIISVGDLLIIKIIKNRNGFCKVLSRILIIHAIFGAAMGALYLTFCGIGLLF